MPDTKFMSNSIIDILAKRAIEQPNKKVFTFLENGEHESGSLTYATLDFQSRQLAAKLLETTEKGERALILLPQGLDYIVAVFGCFYAGVIAVPAYPPKGNKKDVRILSIYDDCNPEVIISNLTIQHQCEQNNQKLLDRSWLLTDNNERKDTTPDFVLNSQSTTDTVLLQYTSGSTGDPKGVMITHQNIMVNSKMSETAFSYTPQTKKVSWLPTFHDFGLFGDFIQAIYSDYFCVMMSPQAFVQKPIRWLRAISKYKGTHTNAPNFGIDICVNSISPEECNELDLSSWNLACIGAEPIRKRSLDSFSEKFAPYGFKPKTFFPAYGLAEATLIVTAIYMHSDYYSSHFDKEFKFHKSDKLTYRLKEKETVSCGTTHGFHTLKIVDPETKKPLNDNEEGEVWFKGETVSPGYWQKEIETNEIFNQELEGETGYLRTGDLGFIRKGELFITGRIKDLVIVNGQNFYPDDLEFYTGTADEALVKHGSVAFSVEHNDREKLIIVQELKQTFLKKTNYQEVLNNIRVAISGNFEVEPDHIVLVKTKSLYKTSSGKLMRSKTRQQYLSGALDVISEWHNKKVSNVFNEDTPDIEPKSLEYYEDIIIKLLSQKADVPTENIVGSTIIKDLALESIKIVEISVELESFLSVKLDPSFILQFDTVREVAQFLQSKVALEK